jgi:hypothetical protein
VVARSKSGTPPRVLKAKSGLRKRWGKDGDVGGGITVPGEFVLPKQTFQKEPFVLSQLLQEFLNVISRFSEAIPVNVAPHLPPIERVEQIVCNILGADEIITEGA